MREMAGRHVICFGKAGDNSEKFEFMIEPYVVGGFLVSVRYSGDGFQNTTGAGVWASVEEAKGIAEEMAARLLHGAVVAWDEPGSSAANTEGGSIDADDEKKLIALRQAIDEGIASGIAEGDVFARLRERFGLKGR
jgi:hypothetical protein